MEIRNEKLEKNSEWTQFDKFLETFALLGQKKDWKICNTTHICTWVLHGTLMIVRIVR